MTPTGADLFQTFMLHYLFWHHIKIFLSFCLPIYIGFHKKLSLTPTGADMFQTLRYSLSLLWPGSDCSPVGYCFRDRYKHSNVQLRNLLSLAAILYSLRRGVTQDPIGRFELFIPFSWLLEPIESMDILWIHVSCVNVDVKTKRK